MNAAVAQREDNFEWLGKEMRAKSMTYEVSVRATGEKPIGWEDKAGAFAKMDDELQKDLAYIIATGDFADNKAAYKRVIVFLTKSILAVASNEKKYKKDKLPMICRKIAEMELFFFLYDFLREDYTLQGKLRFVGLLEHLEVKTYQNQWQHYGDAIRLMLGEAKGTAYLHIERYRIELYKNS